MRLFVIYALVGLAAQLVDGSLGMGYGVTSTTLLVASSVSPAAASASVHLAEIGTSLVSGAAHWRFGNVDWGVVARIGLPGAVGAFAGATVLSGLSTEAAAPWTAGLLLALGVYILSRFTFRPPTATATRPKPGWRFLTPLGLVAGFVDATGGGGWGPIANTTLIGSGRLAPRKAIGSVNTSEFVVTVAASIGFFFGLGGAGLHWTAVGALLLGGLVAAPVAAWLVHRLPTAVLGTGVGGLVILTNTRTLLRAYEVGGGWSTVVYLAIVAVWITAVTVSVRIARSAPEAGTKAPVPDRA